LFWTDLPDISGNKRGIARHFGVLRFTKRS